MTQTSTFNFDQLKQSVQRAAARLVDEQRADGHWIYELEADVTIPAEYVLLVRFLGETPNRQLEEKIARYLQRQQLADGGWPLVTDGQEDISASVKAYFALKIMGEDIQAEPMQRARQAILKMGGVESANVFTRIQLALFGIISWYAVPMMPVEIMLLPKWFPFHLSKISYWARTVIVPLLVLQAKKPLAKLKNKVQLDEIFHQAPVSTGLLPRQAHQNRFWFGFFRGVDVFLRLIEAWMPHSLRTCALKKAVQFVEQRLNGENGLGAIYPAMANAVMMFQTLGYEQTDPHYVTARQSIEKLLVVRDDEAYCQPCLSPVWDTAWAAYALIEVGEITTLQAVKKGLEWLQPLQILDVRGDWISRRPNVRPGGWAFQYTNPHYPDVDDTAVVAAAMQRLLKMLSYSAQGEQPDFQRTIARAKEWVIGMQSENGGWGAFEPENTHEYLNNIPFSDHGALLDPPTVDVSARCLSMLVQLGDLPSQNEVAKKTLNYLLNEQQTDGSWYGRWGVNYIYGTWSALSALNAAGLAHHDLRIRRAARWLLSIQNQDGGWGESVVSYRLNYQGYTPAASTVSHTAWALLGLMAAGKVDSPEVEKGMQYLLAQQQDDGLWKERAYTGTGFPRVFYLKYHGYPKFFALLALARYQNLKEAKTMHVAVGL